MSAVATRELTEDALAADYAVMRGRLARDEIGLVVGRRARLNADRIVRSPGGPLYQLMAVIEDPRAMLDHWSLVRLPKPRRAYRRRITLERG